MPHEHDDLSPYLAHFTKPTITQTDSGVSLSILADRKLIAENAFGVGRRLAPNSVSQQCVCFSEIPLHLINRIAHRRNSEYGLGFPKEFAKRKGAQPVWYVEKDSQQAVAIETMMATATEDARNPTWQLTPFIDLPGTYGTSTYRFEWEREWRCVGDFTFDVDDVAFLILPEEIHETARNFFTEARVEHTGPAYFCPYIDHRWDKRRIAEALMKVHPTEPVPTSPHSELE